MPLENQSPIEPSLLQKSCLILEQRFNSAITVTSAVLLSEPDRRNKIIRMMLKSSSTRVPQSVILKQSLQKESCKNDQEVFGRFARDWAGLEFLSNLSLTEPLAPKFYGGNEEYRFILLEDLGKVHFSLVDSLMSDNSQKAIKSLERYMRILAQFHGQTFKHFKDYEKILHKIHPYANAWLDNFDNTFYKASKILERLNIDIPSGLKNEVVQVFNSVKKPGAFATLIHGDICPDNVFDDPENARMHLIDFEWSYAGNALLDATYLRMSNPTCWCVKAFPEEVIEPLEKLYRQTLISFIPAASENLLYEESYVCACAYWVINQIINLKNIIDKEIEIGSVKETNLHPLWHPLDEIGRPRTLSRFQSFINISEKYHKLSHLQDACLKILKILKQLWPEVKPLEYFPALRKDFNK